MLVWQSILFFGIIAVIFDGIWAVIARDKGYSYAKGAWVSSLIYVLAGWAGSQNGNIPLGAICGFGVAAIEATIGWWVSWKIGPGRPTSNLPVQVLNRVLVLSGTVGVVMLTGAFFGILGAVIDRFVG